MKRAGVFHLILAGFFVLASFAPAWASEGHEAGQKGLPQMDATLFPGILFWVVLMFGLLFIVMQTVAVPGVRKIKARRASMIEEDLAAARVSSEQAQTILAANEKALEEARLKAQKTVGDILHAANIEATEQREKQQRELTHRLQVVQENLAAEKTAALADAPRFVNEIVMAIVSKATGSAVAQKG